MTYWPDNNDDTIDLRNALTTARQFVDDPDVDQVYITELQSFLDDAALYAEDFPHGVAINDSYFARYAEEFADDIGAVPHDNWPLNCIDWEDAAEQLKMDYTEIMFDGASFWVR